MAIKLVTCDLDETLLPLSLEITPEIKHAVTACTERGIYFVPSSGRGYGSIQPLMGELGLLDNPDAYVLSFNGSLLTQQAPLRVLHRENLDLGLARRCFERGLELGVCMHVYTEDKVWVWDMTDEGRRYIGNRAVLYDMPEPNLDCLDGEPIIKVLYQRPDMDFLRSCRPKVEDFAAECEISYSSGRYMEFNKRGVSKGAGLKLLRETLGLSADETMAIGDNLNDASMIKEAHIGVSVANALDELKAMSDYVCQNSYDKGVVEALERFCLP